MPMLLTIDPGTIRTGLALWYKPDGALPELAASECVIASAKVPWMERCSRIAKTIDAQATAWDQRYGAGQTFDVLSEMPMVFDNTRRGQEASAANSITLVGFAVGLILGHLSWARSRALVAPASWKGTADKRIVAARVRRALPRETAAIPDTTTNDELEAVGIGLAFFGLGGFPRLKPTQLMLLEGNMEEWENLRKGVKP